MFSSKTLVVLLAAMSISGVSVCAAPTPPKHPKHPANTAITEPLDVSYSCSRTDIEAQGCTKHVPDLSTTADVSTAPIARAKHTHQLSIQVIISILTINTMSLTDLQTNPDHDRKKLKLDSSTPKYRPCPKAAKITTVPDASKSANDWPPRHHPDPKTPITLHYATSPEGAETLRKFGLYRYSKLFLKKRTAFSPRGAQCNFIPML